jgi:glutaredoxin 3
MQLADGSELQAALLEHSGQRTVPNIFINKKHMGGCDDLKTKHENGQLKQALSA